MFLPPASSQGFEGSTRSEIEKSPRYGCPNRIWSSISALPRPVGGNLPQIIEHLQHSFILASSRHPGTTARPPEARLSLIAMAMAPVEGNRSPVALREKDGPLEPDEMFEDAREAHTPPSGDELSAKERAALTRRVLMKLDFRYQTNQFTIGIQLMFLRILPVLTLLFLCSFLDRTNVGNAKTYKLETDLHMSDHQYEMGLAVYYATYIAM